MIPIGGDCPIPPVRALAAAPASPPVSAPGAGSDDRMSDNDAQVDQHGLTSADHDAIVEWWRGTQHRGVWYQQPRIKNRPLRNSFTNSR